MEQLKKTAESTGYGDQPKLGKPGAGLPWFERTVAKYFYVFRLSKKMSWEAADAWFLKEGEKILAMARTLSPDQLQEKVLIDRIQGIEDSSRFWSVAMTMEHLMTVGTGIAQIIVGLSKNEKINYTVDTAKVKPFGKISGAEACAQFESFLKEATAMIQNGVKDRESKSTHAHPWFGQLTSRQWHWLTASHQGIHRRQIALIVKGLGSRLG